MKLLEVCDVHVGLRCFISANLERRKPLLAAYFILKTKNTSKNTTSQFRCHCIVNMN